MQYYKPCILQSCKRLLLLYRQIYIYILLLYIYVYIYCKQSQLLFSLSLFCLLGRRRCCRRHNYSGQSCNRHHVTWKTWMEKTLFLSHFFSLSLTLLFMSNQTGDRSILNYPDCYCNHTFQLCFLLSSLSLLLRYRQQNSFSCSIPATSATTIIVRFQLYVSLHLLLFYHTFSLFFLFTFSFSPCHSHHLLLFYYSFPLNSFRLFLFTSYLFISSPFSFYFLTHLFLLSISFFYSLPRLFNYFFLPLQSSPSLCKIYYLFLLLLLPFASVMSTSNSLLTLSLHSLHLPHHHHFHSYLQLSYSFSKLLTKYSFTSLVLEFWRLVCQFVEMDKQRQVSPNHFFKDRQRFNLSLYFHRNSTYTPPPNVFSYMISYIIEILYAILLLSFFF